MCVGLLVPDADVTSPWNLVSVAMGACALIGSLPSLLVIGVPTYVVGTIAVGDPFLLAGSLPVLVMSVVLSVLANAALLEVLARRQGPARLTRRTARVPSD